MLRAARQVRLLPLTMAGLGLLLAVKSVGLVGAAYGAAEAVATAGPAAASAAPAAVARAGAAEAGAGSVASPASVVPPVTALPPMSPPATSPVTPLGETMPSPAELALLTDLRKRRIELDARGAELDGREALLKAAEKRLLARVDELTSLQKRLEALDAARRDRDEASWRGLVRVYETMKPKDAAVIFNDLDPTVLLQVVDRMKDAKAASVLAAMAPDRARRLTADLSALRSRANAPPGDASPDLADHPIRPVASPSAAPSPATSQSPAAQGASP